jgi:opacity protein-like surface antigen
VIVEVSHMGNVGTSDLDERAAVIANSLGGTASTAFKVTEFSAGVRYRFPVTGRWQPYVLGAVGAANVKTEVAFTVNGAVIDPSATVQLGSDLSGSLNKTILVLGFGVNVPFKTRYFGEIGYRFGSILPKTDNFETDKAIPTQRIILGVGVRFKLDVTPRVAHLQPAGWSGSCSDNASAHRAPCRQRESFPCFSDLLPQPF